MGKKRKTVYDPTLSMTKRVSVRLTNHQAHELLEVCKMEHCAPTVLIRELIQRFLDEYEVKRGQIPAPGGDK